MKAIRNILLLSLLCGFPCLGQELELRAGQSVQLKISGVPQKDQESFNAAYSISENGEIRLQYIGVVSTTGLKPSELAARIEQLYKSAQIYGNPTINVMRQRDVETPFVTVMGEVRAPVIVTFRSDLKVLSAIVQCGGFSDYADERRVKLTREGVVKVLDLRKADSKDDVELKPGDKVTVIQQRLRLF